MRQLPIEKDLAGGKSSKLINFSIFVSDAIKDEVLLDSSKGPISSTVIDEVSFSVLRFLNSESLSAI